MHCEPSGEKRAPALDAEHVAELLALDKGKGAVFARFVDLFVTKGPDRIAQIRELAAQGDLAGLAEAAHTLRGGAGNIGAFRLAVLLGRIEAAGKTADSVAAREGLALLDAEFAETREALLSATKKRGQAQT